MDMGDRHAGTPPATTSDRSMTPDFPSNPVQMSAHYPTIRIIANQNGGAIYHKDDMRDATNHYAWEITDISQLVLYSHNF